jgi:hypothetical protein
VSVTKFSKSSLVNNITKLNTIWDQETYAPVFESIASYTVTSTNSAYIEFHSIPQNYQHLQIRCVVRSSVNQAYDQFSVSFNNDRSNSYSFSQFFVKGDSPNAGIKSEGAGVGMANAGFMISMPGGPAASNVFGCGYIDIFNYSSNTMHKTVFSMSGNEQNGAGRVRLDSFGYESYNPIHTIDLIPQTTGGLEVGSVVSLYGVK